MKSEFWFMLYLHVEIQIEVCLAFKNALPLAVIFSYFHFL